MLSYRTDTWWGTGSTPAGEVSCRSCILHKNNTWQIILPVKLTAIIFCINFHSRGSFQIPMFYCHNMHGSHFSGLKKFPDFSLTGKCIPIFQVFQSKWEPWRSSPFRLSSHLPPHDFTLSDTLSVSQVMIWLMYKLIQLLTFSNSAEH